MTDDEYRKAIAANAARANISYRNGDDISGDYWTEQTQRLSDQYEATRARATRRHCGPASFYAKPANA